MELSTETKSAIEKLGEILVNLFEADVRARKYDAIDVNSGERYGEFFSEALARCVGEIVNDELMDAVIAIHLSMFETAQNRLSES